MVSGASILAEQLAQSMARRGHEVLVIAASDTGRRYSFQKDNLTVLRLESFRNPARANQRLLRFPGTAVMQELQDFKPDLIHAHEPFHSSLLGLKYAR
ncbi:MAG TPA: glycosyltransferase, partial [Leptospiraceae bacterium]|nr:glycosyltransferase [Leptospiraceae bacterium]